MNLKHFDNLLLADWVYEGSLYEQAAEEEICALENLVHTASDLYEKGQIQAVIWIQKVPYSDFRSTWKSELEGNFLRDDLRWRLARIYCLRRSIQDSPFPWIYLSEHDCIGALAELVFSCHRRFVFDTETWFGFPEVSIKLFPCAGWLSQQIHKKPRLMDLWRRNSVWKAEEAVEVGLLDAAISWKDWRVEVMSWASRQIHMWEIEGTSWGGRRSPKWKPLEKLWPERGVDPSVRSHLEAYFDKGSRRLDTNTGIDAELIDTAAHFMCQAYYESWIGRAVSAVPLGTRKVNAPLIYIDISEALPPLALVSRLLDAGSKIAFLAESAETLKVNLEQCLGQIENKYRRNPLQIFEKQITWYVGNPPNQSRFPTFTFGSFRDFRFSFRESDTTGWVLSSQRMERQAVEIGEDNSMSRSLLAPYFDAVYHVRRMSYAISLVYLVKSLVFQVILQYAASAGMSLKSVLEELRGIDWTLLGSERHWGRFFAYRASLKELSILSVPEKIGRFKIDRQVLRLKSWADVEAYLPRAEPQKVRRGPGLLHNLLSLVSLELRDALVTEGWLSESHDPIHYLADAMGYPPAWGNAGIFSRRIGIRSIPKRGSDYGLTVFE